jgi:hypothetical protein
MVVGLMAPSASGPVPRRVPPRLSQGSRVYVQCPMQPRDATVTILRLLSGAVSDRGQQSAPEGCRALRNTREAASGRPGRLLAQRFPNRPSCPLPDTRRMSPGCRKPSIGSVDCSPSARRRGSADSDLLPRPSPLPWLGIESRRPLLSTKPHLLRQRGSHRGITRGDHRVVARQSPFLTVGLGGEPSKAEMLL